MRETELDQHVLRWLISAIFTVRTYCRGREARGTGGQIAKMITLVPTQLGGNSLSVHVAAPSLLQSTFMIAQVVSSPCETTGRRSINLRAVLWCLYTPTKTAPPSCARSPDEDAMAGLKEQAVAGDHLVLMDSYRVDINFICVKAIGYDLLHNEAFDSSLGFPGFCCLLSNFVFLCLLSILIVIIYSVCSGSLSYSPLLKQSVLGFHTSQ